MSIEALNWAWEQPVTKAANKLVLLALADHANGDGECWPSMKRIADRSDISARHVSRAINELVDLGLVEKANRRRHGGQYRGWDYRLNIQQTPATSGHGRPVTSGHGRPSPADTGVRSEPPENRKEEPLADKPPESATRKKDDLRHARPYGTPTSHRSITDGNLLVLPRVPGRSTPVQNPPCRNRQRTPSTQDAPSSLRVPMGHPPCRTIRLPPVPQDPSRSTHPPTRTPT
jgi:hypothetical protein